MTTTIRSWRQQLASVLEWSAVDKGQIMFMMLIPIMGQYLLWALAVLARPDRDRLVNVPALTALMAQEIALMAVATGLVLLGLGLRRTRPDSLWFQHLAAQFYATVLCYLGYHIGLREISTGIVLLGAPVFGFIVLDRKVVWLGTATGLALTVGLNFATATGHLPYAPVMRPPVDVATELFRLNSVLGFAAPHFVFILLLADQTLHYWRAREATIRELSRTDTLTGLPNRRSILELLDKEVARTRRHGPPMCVVILDLDHFKKINDTWGHPTGDKVLVEAARVLRDRIRTCDGIGRYGGEEFLLVLPDTDADGAAILLERCRAALSSTLIRAETGKTFHISASFGVVCNQKDMTVDGDALIKAADDALYVAKQKGRNRIEIAA